MVNCPLSLRASSPGRSDSGAGKERKGGLQIRLWNLNSTSISLVAPRRRSCQIKAEQREAETSANENKHWKTSAKSNDVITNVISANQHFLLTFSMQIFKFYRRCCKLSPFLSFPAPLPERHRELARRLLSAEVDQLTVKYRFDQPKRFLLFLLK